jgi:hypothetical protein
MLNNKDTIAYRKYWIDLYKISNGCCVCGYNKHPSALCFDHIDGDKREEVKNGYSKRSSAGGMYKLYSKKYDSSLLIEEIKKCRIVCCNCHMEITHKDPKIDKRETFSLKELIKKL